MMDLRAPLTIFVLFWVMSLVMATACYLLPAAPTTPAGYSSLTMPEIITGFMSLALWAGGIIIPLCMGSSE